MAEGVFRRLVTDRNAAWTAPLDRRLKGRGRTVVVVGVGHLVGDEGLPARLNRPQALNALKNICVFSTSRCTTSDVKYAYTASDLIWPKACPAPPAALRSASSVARSRA